METEITKTVSQSLTIRGAVGSIIMVLALLATYFGYQIGTEVQTELAETIGNIVVAVTALGSLIGNLISIIGRIRATAVIQKPKKR